MFHFTYKLHHNIKKVTNEEIYVIIQYYNYSSMNILYQKIFDTGESARKTAP